MEGLSVPGVNLGFGGGCNRVGMRVDGDSGRFADAGLHFHVQTYIHSTRVI